MTDQIEDTPANRRYVYAMNIRIADELRFIKSQVWLARLLGGGIFFILLGIVIFVGCLAYKNINQKNDETILAKSVEEALDGFVLKAKVDGAVKIENPIVQLIPNQSIAISEDSSLKIADGESVTIKGDVSVAMPLQNQGISIASDLRVSGQKNVQTNAPYFTVFKSMPYNLGFVYTGWKFLSTSQKFPTEQYCYYIQSDKYSDMTAFFHFAENGTLGKDLVPPSGVNINEAMDLCIWFTKGIE